MVSGKILMAVDYCGHQVATPLGWLRCLTCGGRSWAGPERGSEILCVLMHGIGSTPPPPPPSSQKILVDGTCLP